VCTGSSGRAFSSSLTASGRGPIVIGWRAVSCAIRAGFLVILESEAAEGAPFFFLYCLRHWRTFRPSYNHS
jgi:hypothetical protein